MRVFTRIVTEIDSGRIIESEHYEYDGPIAECRGENEKAWNKSQIAKSNAGLAAAGGYGTAAAGADPTAQFKDIAANPMSATERASRLGGIGSAYDSMSQQAGERTARTRNSAGYGELLDELARGKARDVATTAGGLDTEAYNRRMQALKGMQGIYGTDVAAQTNLLRPGEPVRQPGFWDQFVLQAMGNANQAAKAGGFGG